MAKQTLLDMTQGILSRLDSDSCNSIADSPESLQVANIIKTKYYDIITRGDLPQQEILFQLDPSDSADRPTLMYVPDGVTEFKWIKYFDANPADGQGTSQFGAYSHGVNTDLVPTATWVGTSTTSNTIGLGSKTFTVSATLAAVVGQAVLITSGANNMFGTITSYLGTTMIILVTAKVGSGTYTNWFITNSTGDSAPGYKYVSILPLADFLEMINRYNPFDDNVFSYTFTEGVYSFTFYYKNNIQPTYCTLLENRYLLFDSFDSNFDTTLQASKSLCFGQKITPFLMEDTFIPDIDDNQFPLLINEATSLAFFEMKQTPHIKAEQEIKRQWSAVQKNKSMDNKPTYFDQLQSFGRVPRTGGYAGRHR